MDPVRRGRAVQAVTDAGDSALAPLLVDRLEDEDPGVRLLAAEGLRRLAGDLVAYQPDWPAGRRAAAAEDWRRQWARSTWSNDEQSHHIH